MENTGQCRVQTAPAIIQNDVRVGLFAETIRMKLVCITHTSHVGLSAGGKTFYLIHRNIAFKCESVQTKGIKHIRKPKKSDSFRMDVHENKI